MAYSATTLLEARKDILNAQAAGVTRNELRMPIYGALKAHLDNTPLLIPGFNIEDLRKYTGQPTKIGVMTKGAAGSGTSRKCAGTGTGTTAQKPLTFTTIVEEFAVSYLESATNQLDYQRMFTFQLAERLRSANTRLDVLGVAHLEAIKSTVNNGTRYGTSLASAKRVPFADYNRLAGRLTTEMVGNDFAGLMDIVASPNLTDMWKYVQNQGGQNGENLSYQTGDFRLYPDRFVADGTGVDSTAYVFAPGTIGLFPWTNQLARAGKDIGTDIWDTFTDPTTGITWELKVKKGCADSSSTVTGGEADYVESFVLSAEFAFTEAYTSTGDTGVYKYEVLDEVPA